MPSRSELVESLNRIQRKLCTSDHYPKDVARPVPERCCCKFGATNVGAPTDDGNGCPEVRLAALLFAEMSDADYEAFRERYWKRTTAETLVNAEIAEAIDQAGTE